MDYRQLGAWPSPAPFLVLPSIVYIRASVRDFANVLHRILIENFIFLKKKSIEKGLPTVGHPLKMDFLKRVSIENAMA